MIACDGCGAPADDRHIRERIARLELATRFRPIHIQVLILDAAPPAAVDDYFYRPANNGSARSREAHDYFRTVTRLGSAPGGDPADEESALEAFQRRAYFWLMQWNARCRKR